MPKSRKVRQEQQLKPLLRIYCEGTKTEPNYIQGYLDKFFSTNRRLKVVKIEDTKKNTPKELVGVAVIAKKLANKTGLSDAFWVVYDRESQHKYSDALHYKAYDTAQKNNISVALSNVCFEVWLLLHLQNTTAPYSCYDDLRNNSSLRKHLKIRGIQDYDKGAEDIFNFFSEEEIKNARVRAYRMNIQTQRSANSSQTKPYHLNPYTDVYKLLDAIDEIARKGT
jgi:RloB-like protein